MIFQNPYAGCKDSRRLNLPVPSSDYDQLRSVLLNPRDLTTTLGLIFNAIVTRCRNEQWDFSNRDDLVAVIADCVDRINRSGGLTTISTNSRRSTKSKRRGVASKDEAGATTIPITHISEGIHTEKACSEEGVNVQAQSD